MEEKKDKLQIAVDILFGKGITTPEYLAKEFESIYRAFVYNHIWSDDNAKLGCREACDAIYNLEALIDGLRGERV